MATSNIQDRQAKSVQRKKEITAQKQEIKGDNQFARLVRMALASQGITQAALAKKMDRNPGGLSSHLVGNNLREADMRALADALGYDVRIQLISRNNDEILQ